MDKKKPRTPRLKNADESENQLFVDILKTANDGKLWKSLLWGHLRDKRVMMFG